MKKDFLKLKELFTSSVECTGDLASDFTYYFYESEQTHSVVYLGMLIDVDNTCKLSGGMIIQLLPNASEQTISYLEDIISKFEHGEAQQRRLQAEWHVPQQRL